MTQLSDEVIARLKIITREHRSGLILYPRGIYQSFTTLVQNANHKRCDPPKIIGMDTHRAISPVSKIYIVEYISWGRKVAEQWGLSKTIIQTICETNITSHIRLG